MKQLLMLIGLAFASSSFAAMPTSGLSKNSQNLKALGSAWNAYHTIQPKLNKDDIEMGYVGQDFHHSAIDATTIA